MPCLNEETSIGRAIESLFDTFVHKHCEMIVVDGMSTDRTREIVQTYIKKGFPMILMLNPEQHQVFGMNAGIMIARGSVIVRADAHAVYPQGYVKKCLDLLNESGAVNVGGVMKPEGDTWIQKTVALAMQHPLGVGDAKFHLGNFTGFVDTVYLGAYKKEIFDKIGLFDTKCRTNEDAELNLRILKAGGSIYLDSSLCIQYSPRRSLRQLAAQYFRYGRGRAYTTWKHKRITSWRQAAPVGLIIGLLALLGLSFWRPWFLLGFPVYFLALVLAGFVSWPSKRIPFQQRSLLGVVFSIMHITWGAGFIYFLFSRKV
jgi:glycosyltransferase involved in cell wall biosynthesis